MAQTGDKGDKQYGTGQPFLKAEFTFALKPATPYGAVAGAAAGDLGFVGAMPVRVEAATGRGYALFCPGIAAFAHGADPNTANSQIFFMRGVGGPTLESKFTAFGRVIQGQAAIDAVADGEPPPAPDRIVRMRVLADMPVAERPKLQIMDTRGPAFAALLAETAKTKGPTSACAT